MSETSPPASAPAAPGAAPRPVGRRVSDGAAAPILPDACNVGILLRILLPLNVGALLLAGAPAHGVLDFLVRLYEIALVLEPALLVSLVLACALRRRVNGWPRPRQWLIGLGLPALLTAAVCVPVVRVLLPGESAGAVLWWILVRTAAAVALAFVVIEYFRLRALSFSPSLSEARLQALQARIRPHFLFNSLNTVLGLMRSDPRRAEHTLENLADLFRVFMRDTRELVPLDEEVVTCQQYLAIEQLRLGDRLRVRWQIDQMPGDALLPSLLLQPLLENAVHHGIEPRTEPGEIFVQIAMPGDRVQVEIINPVSPHEPTRPGNQMALSNVRERLMLLYDVEAELKTEADPEQFRLYLEFPYRKERRRRDVRRHLPADR